MPGGLSKSKPAWPKYLRVLGHAGFFFCGAAATAWSEPMDQSQRTIGQKIAQVVRAFEKRRTKHGRKWVAVFMNEDTIVIALHGSLTVAEKALAQSPVGTDQIREFHRQLFANGSATLHRKIKSITGMEVRDTTAEIEPTTGSVVQVFTTDAVGWEGPVRSRRTGRDTGAGTRSAAPA